jgi:hypothetical protein
MFTGFASENTPAIQVWDFFRDFANTFAIRSVSLADDCAPIQVFRTGATTTSIRVYLPTAPIEGKQITIVNQLYAFTAAQSIEIYSSDTSGNGSNSRLFALGASDSIVLVYSKQNITYGTSSGVFRTGWISLNKSSLSSISSYSATVGGDNNSITSTYCFIGGGSGNLAQGQNSAVVAGNSNSANASGSATLGGSSNTANQTNSVIIGGSSNTANGSQAAVVGGTSNTATTTNCFVAGGNANSAQAIGSSVLGGASNTANGSYSAVIGGGYGTTRSIVGNLVFTASDNPLGAFLSGRVQSAILILARETTNATATTLTSNSNAAGFTNQVILPNNSAYTFQGTCIAARTAAGDTSSWKFEGAIKRGANAASTALVAAVTPTVIAQDVGAVTWVLAITADTTNGGIAVTVTGQAATTIRWVCKIETTEVTF